jgi:glutamate racemase
MAKIGVFDSGYGGLTILEKMRHALPQYDYMYLGDNARTPYGTRSFEVIYEYTWQCVRHLLLHEDAALVVVACNTASARALRNIQQLDLLKIWEQDGSDVRRVLGVIRPTVERVSAFTKSKHVGVLATPGTVASESYILELEKQDPSLVVTQEACPMWVPLIENGEHTSAGADYFVKKYVDEILTRDPEIDTLILGCTHYPLLRKKIEAVLPEGVHVLAQGDLVAESLTDYLGRHKALEEKLDKNGTCQFLTTEHPDKFRQSASVFLNDVNISAKHIDLQ